MKRRDFLKACLVGGATAAVGGVCGKAWGRVSFEGQPDGMGVLVDTTRCIGCRSCESACIKERNMPEPAVSFEDKSVFQKTRLTDENALTVVNRYDVAGSSRGPVYRKQQCNHCKEPACLTSCIAKAYTKTKEGAVIYNSKSCVGCRNCKTACPFNMPGYSYSSAYNPAVKKCSFCYDTRLKFGKPPACVNICPQEALTFGRRNSLLKLAHERIRETPERYYDHVYGENEVGGTSWLYISSISPEKIGMDASLASEPNISNVEDFLGTVPMVLTIWPALFTGIQLLATRNRNNGDNHHNHSGQEGGRGDNG